MAQRRQMAETIDSSDDDDDLEAELKELAGGVPETPAPAPPPAKKARPTPAKERKTPKVTSSRKAAAASDGESSDSDDDDGDGDWGSRGKGKRRRKTTHRKRSSDDEENDVDVDNADDEPRGSAKRARTSRQSESASSSSKRGASASSASSAAAIKFDDGYDDDMMGDAADRAQLMAMSELERESILAERREKRDAIRQRLELDRRLKATEEASRRATGAGEADEKGRVRSRKLSEKERKALKLKELAAKRAGTKTKSSSRDIEDESEGEADAVDEEDASDEESEGGSDFEDSEDERTARRRGRQRLDMQSAQKTSGGKHDDSAAPASLADLLACQVKRDDLIRWAFWEGFEHIVVGAFVRVNIGMRDGQPVYRIAEIAEIDKSPRGLYKVGPIETDRVLVLRIGTSTRPFRFEFISNSPIVDAEFDRWRADHEARRLRTPTAQSLRLPAQNVARSREHELSPDEVAQIIKAKAAEVKRKSYWAAKVELTARIEEAQADGDQDRLSQLREDLQNLEFDHVRYTAARDSRLSQTRDINRRNRQLQIEREHQYMQKRNQEEASGTAVSDAFQRRQYVSRKIEAAAPPATAAIAKTASDGGARQEQEGPLQKTNGMAAPSIGDLFADHAAMEIDIAVPDSGDLFNPVPTLGTRPSTAPAVPAGPRRTLDLSAYKQARGIL